MLNVQGVFFKTITERLHVERTLDESIRTNRVIFTVKDIKSPG